MYLVLADHPCRVETSDLIRDPLTDITLKLMLLRCFKALKVLRQANTVTLLKIIIYTLCNYYCNILPSNCVKMIFIHNLMLKK